MTVKAFHFWINRQGDTPYLEVYEGHQEGSLGNTVTERGLQYNASKTGNTWYGGWKDFEGDYTPLYNTLKALGVGTHPLPKGFDNLALRSQ